MPQGKKTVPENFHPYLRKTYGNILDEYSSSTYNAKLYIINGKGQTGQSSQTSNSARQNSGSPGNSNSVLTAAPDQTVVLAQTGVTAGNTIENITIPTLGGVSSGSIAVTIRQPNRADFLDQVVLARSFLGLEGSEDMHVYLEINFLGYEAEDDLYSSLGAGTDTGGEIVDIIGPYRWKLKLSKISCSMDAGGSTYELKLDFQSREAYVNRRYRLNQNITAKGTTITEMIESVTQGLNNFYQQNNDKLVKDEVEFDLSGLLQSASNTSDPNKVLIEDENLILPDVSTGDVAKAPLNKAEASGDTTGEQRIAESQQPEGSDQALDQEEVTNIISFMPGESIDDILNKVLAMNPETLQRMTRKQNAIDIEDNSCNKGQGFVQRLRVNASVEELGFDKRTNMSAYKVIYRPVLYRTASSAQFAIPEENDGLEPDDVQSRFQQLVDSGNIRKGYQYLFTGMNDQIIDLDITYDNAVAQIMTPRRGLVGNPDAANSAEQTDNVTKEEDTSVGGLGGLLDNLGKGLEALAKDSVSSLFNGEFSGIQGGLDSLVSTLTQQGFSGTQLSQLEQAIQTGAQAELNQFLDTLDSATLRNIATSLVINPANPTQGTPPNYSPEQSGYQYSEDFFAVDQTSGIDVGDLNRLGFLADVQRTSTRSQLETATKETDTPTTNPVEGVTVDLRNPQSNTIMGQLISQQAATDFMQTVEMTIRGDPWYLGQDISAGQSNNSQTGQTSSDSNESSQAEYAYFDGDANYFFLEIAAPRPWDFDYRDEDSALNSGYWMSTNTSYVFTGVYHMLNIDHVFAGGKYTITMKGQKEQALNPENLQKEQPDQGVVNGSS